MTTLHSLAPKLQDVLSSLSEHGRQHLNEVETDLTQTNVLLKEAITKLGSSFMAIHAAVMAQQQIVDTLLAQAQASDAGIQALRENAAEIGLQVNAAVTGLQFQDMTDQLITRTMQRVVGFRDVLEVLCIGSDSLASQEKGDTILAVLDRMKATLEEESVSLEQALRKAVRQTHMESGDIELF
ncbi:chemotaxis protein [uncultured Oxalicibacterium sp.]|uniref:chemotaxis protein n=1 Tax=uncultured Oxalicibacterium sp. TaxID=1168540 RepID=UPI0025F8AD73|nr:chemotaxis protein [uncultured Oxalicibacterium sp.]